MKVKRFSLVFFILLGLLIVISSGVLARGASEEGTPTVANMVIQANVIRWEPLVNDALQLTVSGPDGFYFQQIYQAKSVPTLEVVNLVDGSYNFELVAIPQIKAGDLTEARNAGPEGEFGAETDALTQSGSFGVEGRKFVDVFALEAEDRVNGPEPLDFVILDDLIVDGSACIGLDCVNGESFGFDTLRLKENNLRIKFQDTSSTASFPSNDWQLTANDSSNGGQNKFSIDDIDGGRTPFTLEAGAPSHSLYVDDAGRLGLGTSTPVVELHIVNGDSPTVRLEQNGSSGFTPQTWDLAGNETNFFVRDATNGSTLPFRIRPGAPSSSVFIDNDGDVGIGTSNVDKDLNVESGSNATESTIRLENANGGNGWDFRSLANNGNLKVNPSNASGPFLLFRRIGTVEFWDSSGANNNMNLQDNGNVTFRGSVTPNSDVNVKENFSTIDPRTVLEKVADLEVTTWNYIADDDSTVHLGPMAQDFAAAFGLGGTTTGISTTDADGVAFASIQALYERNLELEARLDAIEAGSTPGGLALPWVITIATVMLALGLGVGRKVYARERA